MFDLPQLPVFPFDSTSITVTTTVWIGVLITVFFNLRFGWTLSALVVPGYVVPLMMSRPTTAVVIFVEAIITYAIAIWISEANRKHSWWSSLFGRDRFFLIVIVSILVRAVADGWLLPAAGQWFVERFNVDFDYRNELGSFGLIAVALIANYFWKPGLKYGLASLLTCVALTWAVVAWVLVPFTNFNVGSFSFLYEDISVSMLASPKAYIIILVTGWFASWMNLRYAWDFNGILIPALMALLWTTPERILFSFIEAGIVLLIGAFALNNGPLRNVSLQGGRKLAFFFTVCFLIRFALAHTLSHVAPELKVTDFFGMGYLLSTLIAIKIDEKKVPLRMTKGILQVSSVGAVAACLIGFMLNQVGIVGNPNQLAAASKLAPASVQQTEKTLSELYKEERIRLMRDTSQMNLSDPTEEQLASFQTALDQLKQVESVDSAELDDIAETLATINYELLVVENKHILCREQEHFRGTGWFVVTPGTGNGMTVTADNAGEEKWCAESAIFIGKEAGIGSVAIFGAASQQGDRRKKTPSAQFLTSFRKAFSENGSLFVRESLASNPDKNALVVGRGLPDGLDMPLLKQLTGDFDIRWTSTSDSNLNESSKGKATICLSENSRQSMVARSTISTNKANPSQQTEPLLVTAPLNEWLLSVQNDICVASSDQYRSPKEEELLFIDQAILQPMIKLAVNQPKPQVLEESLRAVNQDANSVGYRVQLLTDSNSGDSFILLREQVDPDNRLGWGTAVFRMGMSESWSVEIPRPQYERHSFEFGTNIFQHPKASVLFAAGARPDTNRNGSSDLAKAPNRGNLMNLVRHVLFRELMDRPWLTVQARSIQAPIESDLVIAVDDGVVGIESLSSMKKQLCDSFVQNGLSIEFVDGSKDLAGYEVGLSLGAAAAQASNNKETISLWLPSKLRSAFRQQDPNDNLNAELRACEFETPFASRRELVAASAVAGKTKRIPAALRKRLIEFSESHDVVQLYSAVKAFDEFKFNRYFDKQTNSTLIAIANARGEVLALLNPRGLSNRLTSVDKIETENLQRFILSRSLFLEVR